MSAQALAAHQPNVAADREAVLAEAVRWIGTPYCHQASKRGVGADCLGLIVGIWDALAITPLVLPRHDQRSWAHHADGEPLLDGLRQFLIEKSTPTAEPGDVLALRWRSSWPASHLAVLMEDGTIVHAYEGGRVVRSNLAPWAPHIAACFAFPPFSKT
ncbi:MAG: peptidase P60 [Rhizobiales bacterium]|nr:peptidase P60 [Hyphomicrobiales bacterium]MBO6698678.1 peptidase P60 [Hyphomicrobiales bacterium]MBO6735069.1 peptidase P60 [Hyphomicrobiales bacterium]MBO6911124.1 peptidase P60 [Hyphomicrobiales bacterium]MBO6955635.1 peptidase P60 [Hyphomicrobiales bacterium]